MAIKPCRGPILCFLEDRKHSCTDAAGFSAGTGNLVGIDCLGGIGIRMAQLIGGGHGINTAGDQNGCYRMPECVWVDVGQIVGLAEFIQPIRDTVRVHGGAVILCEKESGILPDICVAHFRPQLLRLPFLEDIDCFRCQTDRAGTAGLGWTDRYTLSPEYVTNSNPISPTNRIITSLFSVERILTLLKYAIK